MQRDEIVGENLGTVVSTIDSPNPEKLSFIVENGADGKIHKNMFVVVQARQGNVFCRVSNLIKTNKYFESAEAVKSFEENALETKFPIGDWEVLLAEAKPYGILVDGKLARSSYPVSPGDRVRVAERDEIDFFLGLDEKGLNLGTLEYHKNEVRVNLGRLIQKHLAILAQSGAGKSFAAASLIEELLDRDVERGRVAVIVFDVHGEYSSFLERQNGREYYGDRTKVIKAKNFRIGASSLSAGQLISFMPKLTGVGESELAKIINELKMDSKKGTGPYGLEEIISAVEKGAINEKTKWPMIRALKELLEMEIFNKIDRPSLLDIIQPGTLTVFDLSEIIDMRKKHILLLHIARNLFNERRNGNIPPFLLVLEEAHQFAPEGFGSGNEEALAKHMLETIAREGRKFGAALCLISQRPVNLSKTALSQCNTHLYLRISNPADLEHIKQSSEAIDFGALNALTTLKVGEALLVGSAVNYPLFFKVRYRKSPDSRHEKSLEEVAREFENKNEKALLEAKELI